MAAESYAPIDNSGASGDLIIGGGAGREPVHPGARLHAQDRWPGQLAMVVGTVGERYGNERRDALRRE